MNGKPKNNDCTTSSPYCFAPKIACHNFDLPDHAVIWGAYIVPDKIIVNVVNNPPNIINPPIMVLFINLLPLFSIFLLQHNCLNS